MWSYISRGANSAAQAAIVGALAFVFLDQLIKWIAFGLSISSLWLELETLALLCGAALAATLPFAMGGGSLLGAMASRFGRSRSFLAIGVALGIIAMLGGFAAVYSGAVCVRSHGLCYQDPVGWIDWGIQRDFLSGSLVYPRRMALSTLFGAIGGGWAARRIVNIGLKPAETHASA